MKDESVRKVADIFFGFAVGVTMAVLYFGFTGAFDKVAQEETDPRALVYFDESAGTGWMSSEEYEASYKTVEFPIADSDEVQTVVRIDVSRYPSQETKPYWTDTVEEAQEFFRVLGGEK